MNSSMYEGGSNLKEIAIEIGAVYPVGNNQYAPMRVAITETRVRKHGQTEDELYSEAVEAISTRFQSLVAEQANNYYKGKANV